MYRLSCDISRFVNESFKRGLDAADALLINNIELDGLNNMPLEKCGGSLIEDTRRELIDHNKSISLMTSRVPVSDPETFNEFFRKAHLLGVENVRIPLGDEPPETGDISEIIKMAVAWGIGVVFENAPDSFFRDDPSMTGFMKGLPEAAGVAFNPAGFVALSHHPFFHVFYASRLKNRIKFLRLNDSLYSTGEPVGLAHGNGEVKELISILLARSFSGYFSVTPYRAQTVEAMAQTLNEFRELMKNL